MVDTADTIMALAFNEKDVVNFMSSSVQLRSIIPILDSLLSLYVTKMKTMFFHDNDFYWLLKLLNTCKDTIFLSILRNYLKSVLLLTGNKAGSVLGECNAEVYSTNYAIFSMGFCN